VPYHEQLDDAPATDTLIALNIEIDEPLTNDPDFYFNLKRRDCTAVAKIRSSS